MRKKNDHMEIQFEKNSDSSLMEFQFYIYELSIDNQKRDRFRKFPLITHEIFIYKTINYYYNESIHIISIKD